MSASSTSPLIAPPLATAHNYAEQLQAQGFAVLDGATVAALSVAHSRDLDALLPSWNDLPPDSYLRDGGNYRQRRLASYTVDGAQAQLQPHRAHWQSTDYNALHGGMERWFAPVAPETLDNPASEQLLSWLAQVANGLYGAHTWFVEVHQFRILAHSGIGGMGRPTPEGAHRDGVDLVAVFLLARQHIKGGETRVFAANGTHGERFTLSEPWSVLLLDDHHVIHESTPIQPADGCDEGWRDTLVVTLRRDGFQSAA